MQVTIEVPERLAQKIQAEGDRLGVILEQALREPARFGLAQEMIRFLAGDPTPNQILAFKASQHSQRRARVLLEKNREGKLTLDEEAEMDEIEALDNFFAVIRARAHRSLQKAA